MPAAGALPTIDASLFANVNKALSVVEEGLSGDGASMWCMAAATEVGAGFTQKAAVDALLAALEALYGITKSLVHDHQAGGT